MIERSAPEELRPRLAAARGTAETVVAELRRIVAALSPSVLERLGMAAALRQLVGRFRMAFPASVRMRIVVPHESLPPGAEEVIYRVAQESLNNVAKHSRATHVNVLLRPADKAIRLRVSDNGVGFRLCDTGSLPASFGLAGMRQRAELLGGTLVLRSAPRKGTVVLLELPLHHRDREGAVGLDD